MKRLLPRLLLLAAVAAAPEPQEALNASHGGSGDATGATASEGPAGAGAVASLWSFMEHMQDVMQDVLERLNAGDDPFEALPARVVPPPAPQLLAKQERAAFVKSNIKETKEAIRRYLDLRHAGKRFADSLREREQCSAAHAENSTWRQLEESQRHCPAFLSRGGEFMAARPRLLPSVRNVNASQLVWVEDPVSNLEPFGGSAQSEGEGDALLSNTTIEEVDLSENGDVAFSQPVAPPAPRRPPLRKRKPPPRTQYYAFLLLQPGDLQSQHLSAVVDAAAFAFPEIPFYRGDGTQFPRFTSVYRVRGFPSLLLFRDGRLMSRVSVGGQHCSLLRDFDVNDLGWAAATSSPVRGSREESEALQECVHTLVVELSAQIGKWPRALPAPAQPPVETHPRASRRVSLHDDLLALFCALFVIFDLLSRIRREKRAHAGDEKPPRQEEE